jgi:hypothetical protein
VHEVEALHHGLERLRGRDDAVCVQVSQDSKLASSRSFIAFDRGGRRGVRSTKMEGDGHDDDDETFPPIIIVIIYITPPPSSITRPFGARTVVGTRSPAGPWPEMPVPGTAPGSLYAHPLLLLRRRRLPLP